MLSFKPTNIQQAICSSSFWCIKIKKRIYRILTEIKNDTLRIAISIDGRALAIKSNS